jgi:hypothetical protein
MTCSDTVDTIKQFYDFSGQSYTVPWFQPTPVQVTTIDSQLSVNNASIFPSGWRRGTGLGTRRGGPLHTGAGTRNVQGVSSRTQAPLGLVPRGMMPVALARLERERLKRHAMFWRQLKALESKRVMW